MKKIKVAVNGYGVIGKRIAEAIGLQDDMEVIGIGDVAADWRIKVAAQRYSVFANTEEGRRAMDKEKIPVAGNLDDLLDGADVVVDCAPKNFGAQNAEKYRQAGVKYLVQGGEKHETTGHSFSAESNYDSAVGRDSTRIISCNTTSIVRTLSALKRADLLKKARGTMLRRSTYTWERHIQGFMNTQVPAQNLPSLLTDIIKNAPSTLLQQDTYLCERHMNSIMNTMVHEPAIPSHQGPDAQSVDPELDVVTAAVKVPQTLSHLHYWTVQLTREASKEEVLEEIGRASCRERVESWEGGGTVTEKRCRQQGQ